MAEPENLVGRRFTRLVVVYGPFWEGRRVAWDCKCDCGNTTRKLGENLRSGKTKSCGCLRADTSRVRNATHGHTRGYGATPEYRTYRGMWVRCYNPRHSTYAEYGAKGIGICDRWLHGQDGKSGFECFLADMGTKPEAGATIDRIDFTQDYGPANCRWADRTLQARNRSSNHIVTAWGAQMTLAEALQRAGMSDSAFYRRIKQGMTETDAIEMPKRPRVRIASRIDPLRY